MADELLTRAELLTYCPGLTSVANATLDAYIDSASRMVENYCHREFAARAVSERHPYRFSPNVILKHTPVTAVSNVTLYSRYEPTADIGNVTNDYPSNMTANSTGAILGYVVKPNSGVMSVDPYSFRVSSEQIQAQYFYEINYTGGYANIPTPVKMAVAKIVDSMANAARRVSLSVERCRRSAWTPRESWAEWHLTAFSHNGPRSSPCRLDEIPAEA